MKKGLERFIDVLGELLAVLTLALIIVIFINAKLAFIDVNLTETLSLVREIAIITVLGLKAMEFALKRNIIVCLFFLALIATAFAMMYYGGVPVWW